MPQISFQRLVLATDRHGLKLAEPVPALAVTITSETGSQSFTLAGAANLGDLVEHITSEVGLEGLPGLHYAEITGFPVADAQGAR